MLIKVYALVIVSLILLILISGRKQSIDKSKFIRKPYKYILDLHDGIVTVYEFDSDATRSCKYSKHYYIRYIFLENDETEVNNLIVLSNIKNESFIYTDDIEELQHILKAKGKLVNWMMTRIHT